MSIKVLTTNQEINEAMVRAREEFVANCIREYGYVPFNKEYLERCWPSHHYA